MDLLILLYQKQDQVGRQVEEEVVVEEVQELEERGVK